LGIIHRASKRNVRASDEGREPGPLKSGPECLNRGEI
jgi:hypothetical protein